ncbi:hypothetical protein ACFPER_14440 [Agromyces aurantiacus]|uniref:Uncharacterized protein n=1 Tax=Agromyces aurantiacus TaxID=165814 RepID=A0ABV9R9K9_9MICO|nr:hypothetical protein [Agromyces aurantiacus]MBM7505107.1 hypothetical protein [Agromyces aurantiacus]
MNDDITYDAILALLTGAAAAHGVYEAEELDGAYDDGWPQWYAAHMTVALAAQGYRIVDGQV